MTMHLPDLDRLIAEFPAERDAVGRLAQHLESARSTDDNRPRYFSAKRLYEIANPSSQLALTQILDHFVRVGLLHEVIRWQTQSLSGARDFQSIAEIPERIHDLRHDVVVDVRSEDLHLYYKF